MEKKKIKIIIVLRKTTDERVKIIGLKLNQKMHDDYLNNFIEKSICLFEKYKSLDLFFTKSYEELHKQMTRIKRSNGNFSHLNIICCLDWSSKSNDYSENDIVMLNSFNLTLTWINILAQTEEPLDEDIFNFYFTNNDMDIAVTNSFNQSSSSTGQMEEPIFLKISQEACTTTTNELDTERLITFETFLLNDEEKNFTFSLEDELDNIIDFSSRPSNRRISVLTDKKHASTNSGRSWLKRKKKESFTNKTFNELTPEQKIIFDIILAEPAPFHLVVDGIAGTGKTNFITHLLRNKFKIIYLVKKKSFLQISQKKFSDMGDITFFTIDAFLMRRLCVKSLPKWLRMLNSFDYNDLLRIANKMSRGIKVSRDTVFFIDEYSLIDDNLCELLNILLQNCNQIMVGDCEQQSPIGCEEDQPINTMLSLGNVLFMYESVRAKDRDLMKRLEIFRSEPDDVMACQKALIGLPLTERVMVKKGIRFIVNSNDRVNFINWSVSTLLLDLLSRSNDDNEKRFIRYQRKVLISNDVVIKPHDIEDDAFADEQFVIVGQKYRMIKSINNLQKGSRIRISRILNDKSVYCIDDFGEEHFLSMQFVEPYDYGTKWKSDIHKLFMFPFVSDIATTVYQIQGITLYESEYPYCYIDSYRMNRRGLYVTLSRFEYERQICGIINVNTLRIS